MPCGRDMHSNRGLFWSMYRDDTTSSTASALHRWRRAMSNRVYMYSDHDLRRTLPHHSAQRWAGNPAMRSGRIAMPCGSDMHSDRDLFWSMHRDDATSFTAIVLHRGRRAVSNRVYMYSDHDLRRTLPHHSAQRWAGNPAMRSGRIAMPCGSDMHSDRDLFWSMHRDDATSFTAI